MSRDLGSSIVDRGSAPDWIIIALGALLLALSVAVSSIPAAIGVIVGLLVVAAGVWNMLRPSDLGVAAEGASGLVTFILPWLGGFSGTGGAWVAWLLGLLIVAAAVWSWASHPAN